MTSVVEGDAPPPSGRLGLGRWMLVIGGAGVAGALTCNAISTDIDRSGARRTAQSAMKAAYRIQPGVLTCRGGGGLFDMSLRQTTLVIPPRGMGPSDALARADQAVDSQACTLAPTWQMLAGGMPVAPTPVAAVGPVAAPAAPRHHVARPHTS